MPEIIFNGPCGRLEGRYNENDESNSPIAIVLHPHPQFGGNMNNKIVYNLFQSFVERGFSTLRFNFRGVGRSQGVYDNGVGELSDAASALDWLQSINPNAKTCWIGGYSFGAWISMQLLMRRPEIAGFISIAPPANNFDFTFLAPCPASGLIVHGSRDETVPEPDAAALAARLQAQRGIAIDYRKIPGATHFFQGKMDRVTKEVGNYLDANVKLDVA